MPRGFNEQEKEHIKSALLEKGKILFSTYGLKKTSVGDLTKAVGIAQGTFYLFFQSKEELYFEILEYEEEIIKEDILNYNIFSEDDPIASIKKLIHQTFLLLEESPLFKHVYTDDLMESFIRKLPPEKIEANIKKDHSAFRPILQKWKEQGIQIKKDPEIFTSTIRSIFLLSLHKKEIGESIYDETIKCLIDFTIDGLIAY